MKTPVSASKEAANSPSGAVASLRRTTWLLKRNPLSLAGLVFVLLVVILALAAPWIAPYDPKSLDITSEFQPPSAQHWFGTNDIGMDVFSRVVWAARVDLVIATVGVALAILVGTVIGAFSGFIGGWFDDVAMRLMDSQESFPSIILGIAMAAVLGPETRNVIIVLAVVNYPMYARLIRAQMLSLRKAQFAEAARCTGASNLRIIFKHLLPNCLGPVYVQGSLNMGWAILLAASLSFIGLGTQMPQAEWGLEISRGARYVVTGEWWIAFFPGVAIFLTVLGFSLMGDGLQDVLDPKRR